MATIHIVQFPEYILTAERYPASLGIKLLGRVVAKVQNPTDEYRPADPLPALEGESFEVIDSEFSALFSVEKNTTAQAKVAQILGLEMEKLTSTQRTIESPCVRTRFVSQHRDIYFALLKTHESDIKELLRLNGGKGYMVVGYKSAVDAKNSNARTFATQKSFHFNVPTGAAVTTATHGALNLGTAGDVAVKGSSDAEQKAELHSVAEGEQIFAIRYRSLVLRPKRRTFLNRPTEGMVDFGGVPRVAFEFGVFGVSERIHREIVSDDESDAEEDDDDEIVLVDEDEPIDMIHEKADILASDLPN